MEAQRIDPEPPPRRTGWPPADPPGGRPRGYGVVAGPGAPPLRLWRPGNLERPGGPGVFFRKTPIPRLANR